jgi:Holliday junction resolvase RusA-like endonuclease
VYTPERTLLAEAKIAEAYKEARGPFYQGPVSIDAVFDSKGINITIEPLEETHTSPLRGDTDNYLKLLCDALNEVAYPDDKRVMIIRGEKR